MAARKTLAQMQLLAVTAVAAVAGKCATEEDCSLGGECVAGVCHCDAAWKPPNCVAMNLLAVNKSSMGYNRGLKNASSPSGYQSLASWGGQSVFEDGEWCVALAALSPACWPRVLALLLAPLLTRAGARAVQAHDHGGL